MPAERFIGGLRILPEGTTTPRVRLGHVWERGPGPNATIPLAELLVDDQRVLLRLRWVWVRRISRVFTLGKDQTTWEAPRDSVSAEVFPREGQTRGVLLRASGLPPAIFWCFGQTRRAALDAFHPRGTS